MCVCVDVLYAYHPNLCQQTAKSLGLHFLSTSIVVGLHSPSLWAANYSHAFPASPDFLETVFMEQRAVEMADLVVSPSQVSGGGGGKGTEQFL